MWKSVTHRSCIVPPWHCAMRSRHRFAASRARRRKRERKWESLSAPFVRCPPAGSLDLAEAAADYRSAGVVGFDLAGAERGHAAEDHRTAFALAARHGLACTCHAGEGDGPDSIRQALHTCGAQRIGHGTRVGEDPALLAEVIEQRIPLEMCLTSNVHTRTVPSITDHPLRRYLEQGAIVTLNTDGRLMDGVTLTDEYHLAHTALGLGREDLVRLVMNACESAFLPEFERVALVARVQSEMESIE